MYQHCQATEDKDMTPFDFITDHLINIDGIFDKHDNGDEQKPHVPLQIHRILAQITCVIPECKASLKMPIPQKTDFPIYAGESYFSDFVTLVFRPPIV